MNTKPTCKTCKWWHRAPGYIWGTCGLPKVTVDTPTKQFADNPAGAVTGAAYSCKDYTPAPTDTQEER